MIQGKRVLLRPMRDQDWGVLQEWGKSREGLWGRYQRFQLDHLPMLRDAYQQTGLLRRESGFLMVETLQDGRPIGFVRYTLIPFPDADLPYPEIGFGIEPSARGQGYACEAAELLVDYLWNGYPTERIAALTDTENSASQHVLQSLGFKLEGVLRRAMFRDGRWTDIAIYGLLRDEWRKNKQGAMP